MRSKLSRGYGVGGELIDLRSYTQTDDFGDFRFSNRRGILKSNFLIDFRSYILRKIDFCIDPISLSIRNSQR